MKSLVSYIKESEDEEVEYQYYYNDKGERIRRPFSEAPFYAVEPKDLKFSKTINVDGGKKKIAYVAKGYCRHKHPEHLGRTNEAVTEYDIVIDGVNLGHLIYNDNWYATPSTLFLFDNKRFENDKRVLEYAYQLYLKKKDNK